MLVYLGVFQIGLAYVWVTKAVRHLPAFEMSLLLLLEPVLNPIWAWLIWKEYPGALVLFGGGVIVVATGIKSVYDARCHGHHAEHEDGVNHEGHKGH